MKITLPSVKCLQLIEQFEGLCLEAYLCPAKVWTIGIGTTRYPNGTRVQAGDKCTREEAYFYLQHDLAGCTMAVDDLTVDTINQNQFDALVSFVYNVGRGAYQNSTLRKLVNENPNDPRIREMFMRWVFAGDGTSNGIDDDRDGQVDEAGEKRRLIGLERRRRAEADLYFGI